MSNTLIRLGTVIAFTGCALLVLSGCSGNNNYTTSTPPLPPAAINLGPSAVILAVGQTQPFSVQVTNTPNPSVTWQVNGVAGGSSATGTIDNTGLYTAPASLPQPQNELVVTVTAVNNSDTSLTANSTVTVSPAPPITVTVVPSKPGVQVNTSQQFTATVVNSANTQVTWEVNGIPGGSSTYGMVTSAGLYQAPAAPVPPNGTVAVSARSQADSTKTNSAIVTITTSTPPVSVTLVPSSANLMVAQSQQFAATVSPSTASQNVTWSLSGAACPSGCGTIDATGLYTAPASVPQQGISVTATATSVADATKSASATITVSQQTPISVFIGPNPVQLPDGPSNSKTINVTLIGVPSGTTPKLAWTLGCMSVDEDGDECLENDVPPDFDGPGTISNSSGSCSSNTCNVTGPDTSITYTAPLIPNFAIVVPNECGSGVPGQYAVVTLGLTITAGPQVISIEPGSLCIWVQSSLVP